MNKLDKNKIGALIETPKRCYTMCRSCGKVAKVGRWQFNNTCPFLRCDYCGRRLKKMKGFGAAVHTKCTHCGQNGIARKSLFSKNKSKENCFKCGNIVEWVNKPKPKKKKKKKPLTSKQLKQQAEDRARNPKKRKQSI